MDKYLDIKPINALYHGHRCQLAARGRTSKVGRILRGEDVSNLPGRSLAIWADVLQAPGWGGNGTTIDHTKFDARFSTHLPLPQKTSRSWTSTRAAWRTWARSVMRRFQFNPLGRHFFCQTKLWGVASDQDREIL